MEENKITTALCLTEEIIKNIESEEIPIEDVCLKAARLSGILDDDKNVENFMNFSLKVKECKNRFDTLRVTVVIVPQEKIRTLQKMNNLQEAIQRIKMAVHAYVSNKYYEMKFSSIPDNIFEKTRIRVDRMLSEIVPDAAKKYLSVYENLKSSNAEDWANAVHSCRRIIKALADSLYPANPSVQSVVSKGGKEVEVGPEKYINRLIMFIDRKSGSENFEKVVGSNLSFLGNRLDALYEASCKGSHCEIKSLEEAERYIIYTYMLIGDIVLLCDKK